jgi:hypothetical protein
VSEIVACTCTANWNVSTNIILETVFLMT